MSINDEPVISVGGGKGVDLKALHSMLRFPVCVLVVLAISLAFGCSGSTHSDLAPISSSSGTRTLNLSINDSHDAPKGYLCLRYSVKDGAGTVIATVQTHASTVQKWAIGWYDDSTIVLDSSDIGICAWRIDEGGTIAELPSPLPEDLLAFGRKIKASKYGR
ncbi:MAG: hypothetical protein U0795_16585 [Pirellulales bacterium]